MARCGCSGSCNCAIVNGSGIVVTGTGTAADPYVIDNDAPFTQPATFVPNAFLTSGSSGSAPWKWTGIPAVAGSGDDSSLSLSYTKNDGTGTSNAPGVNSIALGNNATAGALGGKNDAVAIGKGATATGDGSVAIGYNANATYVDSMAIGHGAVAASAGEIAIGTSTSAVHIRGSLVIDGSLSGTGVASDATVVHLAGAETITGAKTFSNGASVGTNLALTGSFTAGESIITAAGTTALTTVSRPVQAVSAALGNVTVTLPSTTVAGVLFWVKKTDSSANTVTLSATSIDGSATYVLSSQYESVLVESTSTSGTWRVLNRAAPLGAAGGDLVGSYPNPTLKTMPSLTPGGYGTSSAVATLAVDAKGRITAATPTNILITESQVTNLVSDLASKASLSSLTTKGDLIAATGAAAVTRHAIGNDGNVLIADSSQATGLRWGTATGGSSAPTGAAGGDLAGTYPNPTLKTVNASTGTFGAASQTLVLSADAQGRILGLANYNIQIAESQVTNLVSDLASKVALSTFTTKGDIVAATNTGTVARVGAGADGALLAADSTAASGVSWKSVGALYSGLVLNYRGAWSNQAYAPGDVVTYNGRSYVATTSTPAGSSFVGSSTGSVANASAQWNMPLPVGVRAGDVVLWSSAADPTSGVAGIPSTPVGGTAIANVWGPGPFDGAYIYTVTSTDAANGYMVINANASNTSGAVGLAMVFRGVPASVDTFVTSGTASSNRVLGTITPSGSAYIVSMYRGSMAATTAVTAVATSPVQSGSTFINSSANNPHAVLAACYTTLAAGTSAAVTFSTTPTDTFGMGIQVAILNGVLPTQYFAEIGVTEGLVTAKGDLLAGTASGAITRLGVGTDGRVLAADSTAAGGVSWSTDVMHLASNETATGLKTFSGGVTVTGATALGEATSTAASVVLGSTSPAFQGISAAAAAVTVSLPSTTTAGRIFVVKKTDASVNAVTVTATSIDGAASVVISNQYDAVWFESTTTSGTWRLVGKYSALGTDASAVHLAGAETVTGDKTFSGALVNTGPRRINWTAPISVDTTLTETSATVQTVLSAGGARTITLPSLGTTKQGHVFVIKKGDTATNSVTIDAGVGGLIDNSQTYLLLAPFQSVMLVQTNVDKTWRIVSTHPGDSGTVDLTSSVTPATGVTVSFCTGRREGNKAFFYARGTMGTTLSAALNGATNPDYPNQTVLTLPSSWWPIGSANQISSFASMANGAVFGWSLGGSGVMQLTAGSVYSSWNASSAWSFGGWTYMDGL